MVKAEQPIVIKKYATRRLYNTLTSAHITLDDVAAMAKNGADFVVRDAKTGEDITRVILMQVIFEHERKRGQSLLPTTFLRRLIRFYGDEMQILVRGYLEIAIESLVREQENFQRNLTQPFGVATLDLIEAQVRRNLQMFEQGLAMFGRYLRLVQKAENTDPAASTGETECDGRVSESLAAGRLR
jgi:polyhydroxyalkanoate synthesis repressor PhaR